MDMMLSAAIRSGVTSFEQAGVGLHFSSLVKQSWLVNCIKVVFGLIVTNFICSQDNYDQTHKIALKITHGPIFIYLLCHF